MKSERTSLAAIIFTIGVLLGVAQVFVVRTVFTSSPREDVAMCAALMPACGYCGDPSMEDYEKYCPRQDTQHMVQSFGFPLQSPERLSRETVLNFLIFAAPAMLLALLLARGQKNG